MPQSIDALPLTPRIITVIGAVMKAAGYRSTKNYMTAIKKLHISRGHRWDEQLAMSAHYFNLSTTRGIGPVRQSEPLSVERVSAIDIDEKLPDQSFPFCAGAMFILTVFFLLRELEVAMARECDMVIGDGSSPAPFGVQ